jgi:hypothetical protein
MCLTIIKYLQNYNTDYDNLILILHAASTAKRPITGTAQQIIFYR